VIDDCVFDTKEKYIVFLERLSGYCDYIAILGDVSTPIDSIDSLMRDKSEVRQIREFPGYWVKRKRAKKFPIPFYSVNKKTISALKEYYSFLDFGQELGGLDLAFFRKGEPVFYVLLHENMSYLMKAHESHFLETIRQYQIEHLVNDCDSADARL